MKKTGMRPLGKHPDVKALREWPFNAETPLKLLRRSFVTSREMFYVRSHGDIPEVDLAGYRLTVRGLVGEPLELSLEEVKARFPRREVTATLYCAGNRRRELMEVSEMPGKVPWGGGAAGNARWTGASLQDVLLAAGVSGEARHIAFTGLDTDEEGGTGTHFGGSIPVGKALAEDVILAYEMNGEPLAPEHGFPLRVVVGGYVGARSVKWLSEVTAQEDPSDNYYQAREYKLFPPDVTAETADYSRGEMLGEVPLNAVICAPTEGEKLPPGPIIVQGYAIAGGEHCVERVEVSADGGETWTGADLAEGGDCPSAWRFWEARLDPTPGPRRLLVRAVDSASGTQPVSVREIWNFQGYVNNAWHCVNVRCEGKKSR